MAMMMTMIAMMIRMTVRSRRTRRRTMSMNGIEIDKTETEWPEAQLRTGPRGLLSGFPFSPRFERENETRMV
jgi:hypothetical protein